MYACPPDDDTGYKRSWSWCTRRCEVIGIGDREYAGQIRVIHANEDPSDWR